MEEVAKKETMMIAPEAEEEVEEMTEVEETQVVEEASVVTSKILVNVDSVIGADSPMFQVVEEVEETPMEEVKEVVVAVDTAEVQASHQDQQNHLSHQEAKFPSS